MTITEVMMEPTLSGNWSATVPATYLNPGTDKAAKAALSITIYRRNQGNGEYRWGAITGLEHCQSPLSFTTRGARYQSDMEALSAVEETINRCTRIAGRFRLVLPETQMDWLETAFA